MISWESLVFKEAKFPLAKFRGTLTHRPIQASLYFTVPPPPPPPHTAHLNQYALVGSLARVDGACVAWSASASATPCADDSQIDIDDCDATAEKASVFRGIPLFQLYAKGQMVEEVLGAKEDKLVTMLEKFTEKND